MADCRHLSGKTRKNVFSNASKRLQKSKIGDESEVN